MTNKNQCENLLASKKHGKKKPKVEYSSRTNSFLVYTKSYTFKVSEEKRLAYEPLCGHLLLPDTPTAKARWVLIYVNFQIYSKIYKTGLFL